MTRSRRSGSMGCWGGCLAGGEAGGAPPSPLVQGCPGKVLGESKCRMRMPRKTGFFRLFSGLRDSEKERGMHFTPTILGKLVEPINRRQFQAIVERHDGDAYVKCFTSWEHLVALVFAQLCASTS